MRKLILLACLSSFAQADGVIDLTIFHTNDIHSHLHAPKSDEFGLGGVARLSSLLKTLRKSQALSITLDAGDWSEGTWYYDIDTGANMLKILDTMGYDAVVVGNHDYLNGPDRLLQTVKSAHPRYPVLASNLDFSNYQRADDFKKTIPGTVILEKGGLKIGIIGLTQNGFEYAPYLKPLVATSPLEEAIRKAIELRPKVDVLLLLSHNHFILNEEIARLAPGIDAVISGHTHKKISEAVLISKFGKQVPVVETGAWGTFLGELHLKINAQTKKVSYGSYQLHPVLPAIEEDPEVATFVAEQDDKLAALTKIHPQEIIGETEIDLENTDTNEPGLCSLVVKSMRESSHADVAVEVGSLTGVKIPAGPVTYMDAHDAMPHIYNAQTQKEWTIKVWNARGADLELLTKIAYLPNILPLKQTGFFCFDQLQVQWQPKTSFFSFPKILQLYVGQQKLDLQKRYRVAVMDGLLLALKTYNEKFHLGFDLSQIEETGREAWMAIADYIKTVKTITVAGLQQNSRSYTSIADPAIFPFKTTYERGALSLEVSNLGLSSSQDGKVKCAVGSINDPVTYKSNAEVFSPIGEALFSALEPNQTQKIQILWNPSLGIWPIKCTLETKVDGYLGNNVVKKVLSSRVWN